ncbi:MAG: ABC transporter substrate-binding protein [Vulcanimicrobiaceae bacterium]
MVGTFAAVFALAVTAGATRPGGADTEPGVTATEITLGGTHPYSGPASAYGVIGKGAQAYFAYINDKGGVNGRKIVYKDLDDGYSPPQAVQLVRQLVEQDHVFAIFNTLGTAVNTAIRPYLNQQRVPQLFVATGATTWGKDYAKYPWTIGWQPDYQSEAIIYARYVLKTNPNAKIGVLYQNDDYGQDYLTGLTKGLGTKAGLIVKSVSYEVTDPDVSSQVASLKSSGADTFFIFATPKFSSQALVAAAQQSWHPTIYLNNVSNSETVYKAASSAGGAAATNGVISTLYYKDPSDPKMGNDRGIQLFRQIMAKYAPGADTANAFYMYGMGAAFTMVDVLEKAGKDLTRQKLMTAVTHIHETNNPFVYPGVVVQTTPTNRFPITQEQLERYESGHPVVFGSLIDARPIIQAELR